MTTIFLTREPDYTDLDLDFTRNRVTDDVNVLTGSSAIKRAVRNLVMLNFYEKKFNPSVGSNVKKLLFDNINMLSATFLKDAIVNTITNFEPRVNIVQVIVAPNPDNNYYEVSVACIIKNTLLPITIDLYLKRIR